MPVFMTKAQNAAKAAAAAPAVPESALEKKRRDADDILRDLDLPESGRNTSFDVDTTSKCGLIQ